MSTVKSYSAPQARPAVTSSNFHIKMSVINQRLGVTGRREVSSSL
ncbi:Uncharacterised protein [Vibrio cholerae]|nr:Uncharacterised protein [Vibrio cholerae]